MVGLVALAMLLASTLAWHSTVDVVDTGVEQQPGVTNPTSCLWTIDDHWQADTAGFDGYLDPGASAVASHCLIADTALHIMGVAVSAPSDGLEVTVTYQPQNVTFTLTARPDGRAVEWRGCVVGPRYSELSVLPEIPDSDGGRGVQGDVTVTVTNMSGRRVRHIGGTLEFGSSGSSERREAYCPTPKTGPFSLAGAVWQTGL